MNGDHDYKHAVVLVWEGAKMLCCTDSGEPAIYNDSAPAELFAAVLRERNLGQRYIVLSFQVL